MSQYNSAFHALQEQQLQDIRQREERALQAQQHLQQQLAALQSKLTDACTQKSNLEASNSRLLQSSQTLERCGANSYSACGPFNFRTSTTHRISLLLNYGV